MRLETKIKSLKDRKVELHAELAKKMAVVDEVAADDNAYSEWEKDYAALEGEMNAASDELKALEARAEEAKLRAKRVDDLLAEEKEISAETTMEKAPVNTPAVAKGHYKKHYAGDVEVRKLIVSYMAKHHGASMSDVAEKMFPNDPRIAAVVKVAVPTPTTTAAGSAAELVVQHDAQNELIDLLRNGLVYPQMPGMRVLPLPENRGSIRMPRTQTAISAGWVGEGVSIPVSKPTFDSITISPYKLGVISLMTRELMERSDPSYEQIVRDQILQSIAQAVDASFVSDAAGTATSPAGLLNGLVANATTMPAAPTAAQAIAVVNALKLQLANANVPMDQLVFIMPIRTMYGLKSLRSAIDTPLFPELEAGQWQGIPVIATNNVPLALPVAGTAPIILAKTSEIFFGLGKGISLSMSDNAYVQADTAPATPPVNGVSLWQTDMLGIRATLDTTWARRRDEAIAFTSTLL